MWHRSVGIVGVGNMGLAMALRLRDLGREVHVRDIDPAREVLAVDAGARIAATPAALAARCDAVVIAVVDAAQSEEVLFGADGAAASLRPGACVLLCPTIAPARAEAIAARLAKLLVDAIDAPMSGGPARARAGTMSLMGTMEIESALVANTALVAEAAVVGRPDETTGEAICAFVVLKRPRPTGEEAKKIANELRNWVAKEIGPIAKPKDIRFGENLPKTRSGKIMSAAAVLIAALIRP